jgi:hypothetical protein
LIQKYQKYQKIMMAKAGINYEHFKGGKYKVILIARSSEDVREMVLYQQLYDSEEFPMGTFWTRPLEEFDGYKEVDNKKIKRFKEIK